MRSLGNLPEAERVPLPAPSQWRLRIETVPLDATTAGFMCLLSVATNLKRNFGISVEEKLRFERNFGEKT